MEQQERRLAFHSSGAESTVAAVDAASQVLIRASDALAYACISLRRRASLLNLATVPVGSAAPRFPAVLEGVRGWRDDGAGVCGLLVTAGGGTAVAINRCPGPVHCMASTLYKMNDWRAVPVTCAASAAGLCRARRRWCFTATFGTSR